MNQMINIFDTVFILWICIIIIAWNLKPFLKLIFLFDYISFFDLFFILYLLFIFLDLLVDHLKYT